MNPKVHRKLSDVTFMNVHVEGSYSWKKSYLYADKGWAQWLTGVCLQLTSHALELLSYQRSTQAVKFWSKCTEIASLKDQVSTTWVTEDHMQFNVLQIHKKE